jgi:hypothetical protein
MNCKQGDLAMVVGGCVGTQVGKIVNCIRLLALEEHTVPLDAGPVWLVDAQMAFSDRVTWANSLHPWVPDRFLMPINPRNDESVETPDAISVE